MLYSDLTSTLQEYSRTDKLEKEKSKKIREAEESGDFETLNCMAENEIKRGLRPTRTFNHAFHLLNNELPCFQVGLTYKNRLELYFYLKILDEAFNSLDLSQQDLMGKILAKQAHIKDLLVSTAIGQFQEKLPQETEPKPPESGKPWESVNPSDPSPEQPWYTSARYFARLLIKKDPTLLSKRDLLAGKVATLMDKAGIKNRSSKKFSSATIKKAFSNVNLSNF